MIQTVSPKKLNSLCDNRHFLLRLRGSKSSSGETQEQDDTFEHVAHHKQEENWLSCPRASFYTREYLSGLEFIAHQGRAGFVLLLLTNTSTCEGPLWDGTTKGSLQ